MPMINGKRMQFMHLVSFHPSRLKVWIEWHLNRPFVNEALINQYKKERVPKVKAAILTTLGELRAIEFISELKEIASGSDNELAIRALVSLSTMNRQSMTLDERRESSLRLCQLVSSSMVEERRLVCIGLRNLGIGDDDQVFQTLLKLLQDENATVRLEAGKTLTLLRTWFMPDCN